MCILLCRMSEHCWRNEAERAINEAIKELEELKEVLLLPVTSTCTAGGYTLDYCDFTKSGYPKDAWQHSIGCRFVEDYSKRTASATRGISEQIARQRGHYFIPGRALEMRLREQERLHEQERMHEQERLCEEND